MIAPRLLRHALAALAGVIAAAIASPALAQETKQSAAINASRGLNVGLAPELLLPSDGGPAGAGVVLDGRYGFRVGPTVLAPGARLGADIISSRFVGTAMPTFRVTLPVGPLAPYLIGGIGVGTLSNRSETGFALLGGGGLMVHLNRSLAMGAQLTYQRITGTELEVLSIGPLVEFGG